MRHLARWMLSAIIVVGVLGCLGGCGDKKSRKDEHRASTGPSSSAGLPAGMPHEQVIARYSPAVFKVVAAGNYTIEGPPRALLATEGVNNPLGGRTNVPLGTPVIELDYHADLAAGKVAAADKIEYCWRRLAASPERYFVGQLATRRQLKSYPFAEGSAFAVSREGILLTNAHVVADPDLAPDVLFRDPILETVDAAIPWMGGAVPESVAAKLIDSLLTFFAAKSAVTAKFDQAVIVTQFEPSYTLPPPTAVSLGLLKGLDYFRQNAGEITGAPSINVYMAGKLDAEPVEVLAKGEIYPGKDIAILKTSNGNGTRYTDKLICVPLGDSDLFQLGPVLSMGFPGAAIDETSAESASYRVIPMPGEVTARLETIGGWTSLHLTALINHGHSGGPTLDKYGQVIGINVAGKLSEKNALGRPTTAVGYNVAVPINLAKEMLAKAKITPDVGPITDLWNRGQDAYWAGRYAEAAELFGKVADIQAAGFSGSPWGDSKIRAGVNYYVAQALEDARKRAGLQGNHP